MCRTIRYHTSTVNDFFFLVDGYFLFGVFTVDNLKVTMLTFSNVTSAEVTINWAPPQDSSQISNYTVVWRVNGSSVVEGNLTVGNDVTRANVTGLTQGTSYEFSVVSVERGSRASTQEIESDETVTLTSSKQF